MILAVDTETTGTDFWHGCRPFMVSACDGRQCHTWEGTVDGNTRNVTFTAGALELLQKKLDEADKIVFHNANFDMKALESIGIDISGIWKKFEDTLAASHCLCSSDVHGLKELAIKYLRYSNNDESDLQAAVVEARENNPNWKAKKGHPHFPATKTAKWWKMDLWLEPDLCRKYALHDAQRTWLLWKAFKHGLIQDGLYDQYHRRRNLLPVLYRMREVGINLYVEKAKELYKHLTIQKEQIRQLIQTVSKADVDIYPSKQESLRYLLYTVMGLKVIERTKDGKPSTNAKTLDKLLEDLDTETVRYIKAWRTVDKKQSSVLSYIKWASVNHHGEHRVHSSLNLTGTHWTRQTSSDPNQQNFDKSMKQLWGPPPGKYWLYVDVVNIELRIWAYEVGSKPLIEAFERGESVHMIVARALYPEMIEELGEKAFKETKTYTNCKSGTFARMYGGGVNKVNRTYGVKDACAIIDAKIPEVGAYFKFLDSEMRRNGKKYGYPCIFTRQGYRLDVPWYEPHTVPSAKIQGTAGLIVQDMMLQISQDPYYDVREVEMIQQVHDSIIFEIDEHPEMQFTNTYLINKLGEIGAQHIPTCPMDGEVYTCTIDKPQKLIDYKYLTKSIGDYNVVLYKMRTDDCPYTSTVEPTYNWHMDIRSKSDRTISHSFVAKWRQEVIDKATDFIESEIPF